jgi:two-component system nitrate/nitrite response regulator NarL
MREVSLAAMLASVRAGPGPAPLRVLIVDDSELFRRAARTVLEQDGVSVVGTASTSMEALRLTAELQPDVVLVDIDLGHESGFDLAHRLAARDAPVVLISAYPASEFADLIAASPAAGFVPKSELSAGAVMGLLGD